MIAPATGEKTASSLDILFDEFGSFHRILHGDAEHIALIIDNGREVAEILAKVAAALDHSLLSDLLQHGIEIAGASLIEFLRCRIGYEPVEVFYALYFSPAGLLVHDCEIARGTFKSCSIYPKEIARRALVTGAAHVIIAHNHPSGDPTPSPPDRDITQRIRDVCQLVDAKLFDHIIIGSPACVSFRSEGLL